MMLVIVDLPTFLNKNAAGTSYATRARPQHKMIAGKLSKFPLSMYDRPWGWLYCRRPAAKLRHQLSSPAVCELQSMFLVSQPRGHGSYTRTLVGSIALPQDN